MAQGSGWVESGPLDRDLRIYGLGAYWVFEGLRMQGLRVKCLRQESLNIKYWIGIYLH